MKIFSILISVLYAQTVILANDCNTCTEPLRIIVALDASSTVGSLNFRTEKIALRNLVDSLKINKDMRMGILQFSTRSVKIIDISSNITAIKKSITSMKYTGGWTNTKSAIILARDMGMNYWIPNTTNILLIITDGFPQMSKNSIKISEELNKTVETVQNFKDKYPIVDIITIAVGEYSGNIYNFFRTISDFPVYTANNYTEVSNLFANLSVDICTTIINGRTVNKY